MKNMVWVLLLTGLLGSAGLAQQASGPIVRCLDGNYFLVQCNSARLQANDLVTVKRAGQEVARGKVMRDEAGFCSILIESGEAQRMDLVFAVPKPGAVTSDRGPAIPTVYGTRAQSSTTTTEQGASTRTKRDDFFSSVQGGRVLNLNTGAFTTSSD